MWREIGGSSARALADHGPVYGRWLRRRMADGELVALVAVAPGGVAAGSGCVWFQPSQPRPRLPERTVPYILSMYTEPEFRGRGVATRLVNRMVALCRSRRHPRVLLHASRFGRPLYERLGFEPTPEMRLWLNRSLARPASARRRARSSTRSR